MATAVIFGVAMWLLFEGRWGMALLLLAAAGG